MDRRTYLRTGGVALAGLTGLTGCTGAPGTGDGGGEEFNLAILSGPGGFGDKAYNDKAVQGLQKAKDEFGATIKQVEGQPGKYETQQSTLAESTSPDYDLIVCVGFYHADALKKNAAKYPDQKWMIINQGLFKENGEHFPNVAGYVWANHEMSYQAGVVAGTMTTRDFTHDDNSTESDSTNVGFVGGVDSNLINAFERAYVQGVKYVDEDVDVSVAYAGSFEDPAAGRDAALSQYDSGADIVYHAAAGTGPGIFQAAQERDRFAIGVDADQSVTLPEYKQVIMGSAVKFINVGTFDVARGVYQDNWEEVNGKRVLGLAEDAVEFVKGQSIGPELPGVVDDNLEETKQKIIDGSITVPCQATGCQG